MARRTERVEIRLHPDELATIEEGAIMSGDATIAGCVRRIVMHALELEAREMEPERKARLMRIRELRKQGYSWADAKHMAGSRRANS